MVNQLCRKEELKEKFHAIAIDTADEAWALCSKFVCNQNGVDELRELPWGQGYDLAKKEYAQTFRDLAYREDLAHVELADGLAVGDEHPIVQALHFLHVLSTSSIRW